MDNKQLFQIIALDLKRTALGYHSGSIKMADRFLDEVYKRKMTLDYNELPDHLKRAFERVDLIEKEKNLQKRAEYALTYSTIILGFAK